MRLPLRCSIALGNSHVLQTFFVRVNPSPTAPVPRVPVSPVTAEWDVFAAVDGVLINGPATAPAPTNSIGKVGFDNMGKLVAATPNFAATDPNAFAIAIPVSTGAVTPISTPTIKYDMTGMTQYGSAFSVNSIKQDGYTSGKLSKFNTAKDGTIVGSYTNGKNRCARTNRFGEFHKPKWFAIIG